MFNIDHRKWRVKSKILNETKTNSATDLTNDELSIEYSP